MRKQDAKTGAVVWCNSSATRTQVRIVRAVPHYTRGRSGKQRRATGYRVARVDNGSELPRLRTARELHFCAHRGYWPGLSEPADTLAEACAACAERYLAGVAQRPLPRSFEVSPGRVNRGGCY